MKKKPAKKSSHHVKASQKIEKGRVKQTENQLKKHITQMSADEISFLKRRLKQVYTSYKWSPHFASSSRLFNMMTIERLLRTPDIENCIIEYNQRDNDKRVLLRSEFSSNVMLEKDGVNYLTDANLCIVIDIFTGEIITAYWNEVGDNHSNVNMKRYTADLQICS